MAAPPWFRFFSSKWLGGCVGLSDRERGVYITLVALMYEHQGPIEPDRARLSRACGCRGVGDFDRSLTVLIATGKIYETDGLLFNRMAKEELRKRDFRIQSSTTGGRARGKQMQQNQGRASAAPKRDLSYARGREIQNRSIYSTSDVSGGESDPGLALSLGSLAQKVAAGRKAAE